MNSAPLSPEALRARKGGARLAMLTAYDYPTAVALDAAGLDILLVGDSLGEVELGYDSTRAVSLEMMLHHVRAVRNGTASTHICADLSAGTYATPEQAVANARLLVEAGADSVKLEGGLTPQVDAIIAAGIPVMGHVGLLPQTAAVYRREGTTPDEADRIAAEARALDRAGCYRDRDRGRPGRAGRADHARGGLPDHRDRRRRGLRRPGAGVDRPGRPAPQPAPLREAAGQRPRDHRRRGASLRAGRARGRARRREGGVSRPMGDEERRAFLSAGTRTGKLATVRPDGRPHVQPIWFVLDGDDLLFMTGAATVKGRNLRRDPRASLVVDDEAPPFAYVRVDGSVELSEDLEVMLDWSTRIARRYMGPGRAEEYGRRNAVAGELLVRLVPTHVVTEAGVAD